MRIRVVTAGKPSLAFLRDGVDDYLSRLRRLVPVEWVIVKAGSPAEVSGRLLERSEGCLRIAMDERGELPTTRELAARWSRWELRGDIKEVAFLIGAADGHTQVMREACDWIWALSPLTLQHEMALMVLMEQLYRVASLKAGSPYHRD